MAALAVSNSSAPQFVLSSHRSLSCNGGRATSLPADFPRRELIVGLARRLAAHPAVERVWLFGSRARGDHFERSDIDLAIEAPGIDRGEWAKLSSISKRKRIRCC